MMGTFRSTSNHSNTKYKSSDTKSRNSIHRKKHSLTYLKSKKEKDSSSTAISSNITRIQSTPIKKKKKRHRIQLSSTHFNISSRGRVASKSTKRRGGAAGCVCALSCVLRSGKRAVTAHHTIARMSCHVMSVATRTYSTYNSWYVCM